MKVLLISRLLLKTPPDTWGGVEQVVAQEAVELTKAGHEVIVFCRSGSQLPPIIRSYEFPSGWGIGAELAMASTLRDLLKDQDVDFVHDHSAFLGLRDIILDFDIPYLAQSHGDAERKYLQPGMTKVAFCSKGARAHSEWDERAPVLTPPFGTDPADLQDVYPEIERSPDTLMWLAGIWELKRPDIAMTVAEDIGLKIHIYGHISDHTYWHKTYARDTEMVKYMGPLGAYSESKWRAYQTCAAFLFTSIGMDASPGVVKEAQTLGCYPIATRVGGVPELIDPYETGQPDTPLGSLIDVDGYTKGAIVEGFVDTLADIDLHGSDSNRRAMRAHARDRYTAKAYVEEVMKVYERLIDGDTW